MTVLVSALAFVILLSFLILIHEWGHFAAARKFKITVEEFGFGLPPLAKKLFKQGGTVFTLNWIPFGGFVRLKGENALTEPERTAKGSFAAAPIHARVIVLVAGVFMNFILAVLLLTMGFSIGKWIPTYVTIEDMEAAGQRGEIHVKMGVFIEDVISGMGAAKVGVPAKSILHSVDGVPVTKPVDVTAAQEGEWRVAYRISRQLEDGSFSEEQEEFRVILQEERSGIVLAPFPMELSAPRRDVLSAFVLSLRESRVMTVQTVLGIGKLFSSLAQSGKVPEGITGIVGIAQLTHDSVQEGLMTYLRLVALLSLSLAILNVLPFPALDGGRLIFVLAEFVRRKPVNRKLELSVNAAGFIFLILLILLITFYDIIRLF